MGNCMCASSSGTRRKPGRTITRKGSALSIKAAANAQPGANPTDDTTDIPQGDSHTNPVESRTPPSTNTAWEAVSRLFGPPPEPEFDANGESFISVSVRSDMEFGSPQTVQEPLPSSFAGCVPQILPTTGRTAPLAALPSRCVHKLKPGSSCLVRVPTGKDYTQDYAKLPPFSYDTSDGSVFNLRTKGYLKSRQKLPSKGSLYELVQADLYSTNNKHWHIVRRLQLPEVPDTAKLPCGTPLDDAGFPPLLILHILMPFYPAQLFFPQTDGANCSFVYYFRLPEGFDPATHSTPEAVKLLERLAASTGEPDDNSGIRSQVKMIAQVANPQEWHDTGKFSKGELKLLQQYNAKPVLMRPVMRFYRGKNYLEIDFDLHNFSYMARKGLEGYIPRLQPVVWDHGFCIEGRGDDELPEVLLAGVRGYFWDFDNVTPFPVPSLLKNLPEDGAEITTPEDPEGENAEVRAALATGNLSLAAVAAPTTNNTSENSQNALDKSGNDIPGDGAGGMSPTFDNPLHTKAVVQCAAAPATMTQRPQGRERHLFQQLDSFNANNDSFLSAHSSLDNAGSFGSSARSASTSAGEFREAADSSYQTSPMHHTLNTSNQTSPAAIVRGLESAQ